MALISCPECGKSISNTSKRCIHCGFELNTNLTLDEKTVNSSVNMDSQGNNERSIRGRKKNVIIVAVVFVLVAIIVATTISIMNNTETNKEKYDEKTIISDDFLNDTIENSKQMEEIKIDSNNMRPTILDTSEIVVKVNSFSYANSESVYELNLLLDNNTDKDISVSLTNVTIEGFEISTSIGKTLVHPGHKGICDSSVWQKNIDEAKINDWTELSGSIQVREDYYGKELYVIPVVIQKACWESEKTYVDTSYELVGPANNDRIDEKAVVISKNNLLPVLLEQDDVSLSISGFDTANSGTVFETKFVLDNRTNEDLCVTLTNVVINGYEFSTSQGKSIVSAGKKAICDSSVWEKNLDQAHISNWEYLQGDVVVSKGYFGEDLYSIPVIIKKEVWS